MNSYIEELCEQHRISFDELISKVRDGLKGHDISHFTDGELAIINAALELAGEL